MDRNRTWNVRRGSLMKYFLIVIASIAILILIIAITLILTMKAVGKFEPTEPDRIECPGLTEEKCTENLCIYHKAKVGPSCFMRRDFFGYEVQDVRNETGGLTIQLKSIRYETPYGISIQNVTFKVTYLTENILRFQFKDSDKDRYEVPVQEQFPLLNNLSGVSEDNLFYKIVHTNESDVFHFMVKRTDETSLWDTRIGGLLLSDQYLQIASYLPSDNVYGLGEHVHDSLKHNLDYISWPMFARDRPAKVQSDQRNLYGVHPFYTCLEKSGKSHGVFFLNSNAMETTFLPAPAVSFRTIGGILDFFIFVGDNPEHVIQLYTSLIGRPMIPPYWGLGFQLSRFGYRRMTDLKEVLNRTQEAKIPQAVQYLDIDHMYQNMDFTYDNVSFAGLPEFIEKQKKEHDLKWIIILDPAIAAVKNYEPYTSGLEQSIYIKRHPMWNSSMFPKGLENFNITFGKVWAPDYAAFPDFFLNETKDWWKEQIVKHRKTINFDGLWIDMNEPANFGTNVIKPEYCEYEEKADEECWSLICPETLYEDPPYNPLLATGTQRISKKTLCMESIQGSNSSAFLHYNVHSLYGWSQTQATLEAAQAATNTRSLVISRSTYPSSGRYAGHWLGDNHSTADDLKRSIIGILEFNLFGIPYVGADVCGFFGNTTPDLCKRWMQLGAFYPYFRNHNGLDQRDQDPAALGPEVTEASRKAIERRIALNPYLYTLFYKAHVYGNTVVRPVFHEYPDDPNTWDMDTQFMWGHALLITPILSEGHKSVSIYLPKGEWWHFEGEKSWMEPFTKRYVIETDADEYTPIHVRGGVILPFGKYDPTNYPENSTTVRDITLYVYPLERQASGDLFMDDGISIDTIENEAYALYTFTLTNCSLEISSQEYSNFTGPKPFLKQVVVFKITEIASVSNNYTFTTDKKLHSAVITVDDEMKNVQEITWEGSGGTCQMFT